MCKSRLYFKSYKYSHSQLKRLNGYDQASSALFVGTNVLLGARLDLERVSAII